MCDDSPKLSCRDPDVPEWAYDDLATKLVLYLQYPPLQFREKYRLVLKHWRRLEPMKERRTDMLRLREKGKLVFAKSKEGKWYFIDNESSYPAFNVVRRSYLSTLKSSGYALSYSSWKFLRQTRPKRNKMNLTPLEMEPIIKDLEGTLQKARVSQNDFPFMSSLAHPSLSSVVRQSVQSNWRCLFSPGYFIYAVVLSQTVSDQKARRRTLSLMMRTTLVFVPISLLLSYIAKRWFPNNPALLWTHPHVHWLLPSLLEHRKLAPLRFGEALLATLGLFVAWWSCAWVVMLFYSLFAKNPLETEPTLQQKLYSWFRSLLPRS